MAILPELVGKWYSKQPIMPLQSSSSTAASDGASSSTSVSVGASVNQVDSTDSHITKVDATAGSRSNMSIIQVLQMNRKDTAIAVKEKTMMARFAVITRIV